MIEHFPPVLEEVLQLLPMNLTMTLFVYLSDFLSIA